MKRNPLKYAIALIAGSFGFMPKGKLPSFDMHKVEAALKVNHKLYEGKPLDDNQIRSAISQYLLFLARHKAAGAPEKFEVPSYLVDRVWHTHMCETEQYREDCVMFFGKILHHRSEVCNGGVDPFIIVDENGMGGSALEMEHLVLS